MKKTKMTAGFTLVELIVVIAILGILAGVGTVGYSGYIKKANQAADQQLVSGVANAMQLQYYSTMAEDVSGYVVLAPEGEESSADAFGEAAMTTAFGADWKNSATLKYGEWTDDGLLDIVAEYSDDELAAIAGSTFMTASSPEGLMSAVTDMTGLVSEVIAGSDLSQATTRLNALLGPDSHVVKTLNELEVTTSDDEYSTVVSNLLVNEMANLLKTGDGTDNLSAILGLYASMYAYAETTGDTSVLNQFATNLDTISFETLNSDACITYCFTGLDSTTGWSGYQTFARGEQEVKDKNALNAMMGAVGQISGSYTDLESLSNADLYTSGVVAEQVNNYVNSVKALAGMDPTTREKMKDLSAASVAVFIAADGSVAVTPGAAWAQS